MRYAIIPLMIKILVANRGRADLYEADGWDAPLTCVRSFTNPEAHLHESELVSDRAGRSMNRVAGVRQAYDERHRLRDRSTDRFAREVAGAVESELRKDAAAGLLLIGSARLTNRLVHWLPADLRGQLRGSLDKDLTHHSVQEIGRIVRDARRAEGFD